MPRLLAMNGGPTKPDDALQDYLDDLLRFDDDDGLSNPPEAQTYASIPPSFALPANVTPLPAQLTARSQPVRPYAEPIRTLNLRLPLPALLDTAVAEPTPQELGVQVEVVAPPVAPSPPPREAPVVSTVSTDRAPLVTVADAPVDIEDGDLTQMAAPVDWLGNGRPHWAQQPFECLLFRSGGLTLAAPLVELGSIYPLDIAALSSVFGQTSWLMGLLPVKEFNARAVDTAMIVMPERYDPAMREAYRFLITLYGSDWGLAVDAVVNSVVLDPASVRWRGQRSKRPWLAGTVVDQMCALLDISQLAWTFHNQDRKRRQPAR